MNDLTMPDGRPGQATAMPQAATAYAIERAPGLNELLGRMLDVVPYGMVLMHDDGRVVFANSSARQELDEQHPLQWLGGHLKVRRPQDVATFRDAVAAAASRGLQRMVTLGDAATETVAVAVAPAAEPVPGCTGCVLLVFGKRHICENLSADAYARAHGLTPAEARVLKQLCGGRKPTDIAREQGVAVCTVRSQIGGIRQKTGAADIAALVQTVAKLPPLMMVLRAA
jgi:DNA-binding CsgD family transcriptional regulator